MYITITTITITIWEAKRLGKDGLWKKYGDIIKAREVYILEYADYFPKEELYPPKYLNNQGSNIYYRHVSSR